MSGMTPMKPTKADLEKAKEILANIREDFEVGASDVLITENIAQALASARAKAVKEVLESELFMLLSQDIHYLKEHWKFISGNTDLSTTGILLGKLNDHFEELKHSLQGEGR